MLTIRRRHRLPLHISLPDFDKGARCPGWSGAGWKFNRENWCADLLPDGVPRWALTVRQSAAAPAGVAFACDLPGFFSWRLRRTNCCNTIVLPQLLWWFAPASWVSVFAGIPRRGPAARDFSYTVASAVRRLRTPWAGLGFRR